MALASASASATDVRYLQTQVGLQPLTQYYSAARRLHYLSYECEGCPAGGVYAPVRNEGFAFQDPCDQGGGPAPPLDCVPLVILYNPSTGSNLVVPASFAPPPGYSRWGNGFAAWALPLGYAGPAPTVLLEVWTGSEPGGPVDYFVLASNASIAEARAANFSALAPIARLLAAQDDPRNPSPLLAAVDAADVVVLCAGLHSDEGADRPDLALSPRDAAMAAAVMGSAARNKTVVVLQNPGAVVMPWADGAGAILAQWYAGQEMGNALADILWGDVNPSGRTPVTFPLADETPMETPQQWPGVGGECTYSERLEIGYRWWDARNATPRFPFGQRV